MSKDTTGNYARAASNENALNYRCCLWRMTGVDTYVDLTTL